MTKKIISIWAEDQNGLIGANGTLPWQLPKDLQHFKTTTMGQALVMGRVTFDGMGRRLLPGRETLILSRQPDPEVAGVTWVTSPEEVLAWFDQQDKDLYVVGGSQVYEAFAPYVDRLVKTTVHGQFEGDTHFPALDLSAYSPIAEQYHEADEANPYPFTITVYDRRKED